MLNSKKLTAASSFALAMLMAAPAMASTWNIDTSHSEVGFKVRHMMVSYTRGRFNDFSGTFELNEKDITKSKVNVTIKTASVNTDNKQRDDHLRNKDFFNVKKYPEIKFVSTKFRKAGKGKLKVEGKLTMHGVTKNVVLDVEGPTDPAIGPYKMTRRGISASTKISRKDFGLTYNSVMETGGVAIGDEVKIQLEIEFTKKK